MEGERHGDMHVNSYKDEYHESETTPDWSMEQDWSPTLNSTSTWGKDKS